MKPIVSLLLVIGIAVGAWFLIDRMSDDSNGDVPTVDDGGTQKKKDEGGDTSLTGVSTDATLIVPESAKLKTEAAAVLVGHNNDQWTASILQAMQSMKDLKYASWFYELTPRGGLDAPGPGPGEFRGLPGLESRPDANYLEDNDIRVLFLDTLDPNLLGTKFWDVVAQRVRSGRMGLYVRPNFPKGMTRNDAAPTVHPVLTHPVVKDLIPVTKAKELRGTPLPGSYGQNLQTLVATDAGVTHPATRLVPDAEASRNIWNAAKMGKGAISTVFVYPVETPRTGEQILIDMDNGDFPAVIVAKSPDMRVLWMGNGDFSTDLHFEREKAKFQYMLLTHWITWLVGQADD